MSIPLTLTHLRFDCIASTPVKLGGYQAGERLRDALAQVMLRAVCPETQRSRKPSPEHAAACPACWLLAAETDPGEVRRAYSLVPPLPPLDLVQPGQRFSFVLTLFGLGFQYLPYFVLAVPEMGRIGVGPGRGKFSLEAIWALNPLAESLTPALSQRERVLDRRSPLGSEAGGEGAIGLEPVLKSGENVVRVPKSRISWEEVSWASESLCAALPPGKALRVQFLTPTRLVDGDALVKSPDFGVFYRRLLERIDRLGQQHAGAEKRPPEDVQRLHQLADRTRLINADVRWVDLWGPSGRTGRRTPMGGFIGWAEYRSQEWESLLPWLLLGQATQAGKLAVKGNGVFAVCNPRQAHYWEWAMQQIGNL